MAAKDVRKGFVLRAFIEQVGERDFFAICLTVNICARGSSIEDAQKSLLAAVQLYLEDAIEEKAIDKWVPRRAPLRHYLRYYTLWLRTKCNMFLPPRDALLVTRTMYA